MKEKSSFERLREQLYAEVLQWTAEKGITPEFKENFYKLLEHCVFTLMQDEDQFFGYFLMQIKREIKIDMSAAVSSSMTRTYFTIYFNPVLFLECTLLEMQGLLKHEIYHILSLHHIRAVALKKQYSTLAVNLAMDVSVNQYIFHLPPWAEKLENVKMAYHVDLKEEQTIEAYAKDIQDALNRLMKKKGKENKDLSLSDLGGAKAMKEQEINSHEYWSNIDNMNNIAQQKEIVARMADNAAKGKIPTSVEKLMKELNNKPEISWRDYLRRMLGTLPSGYKKIVTRKDRRQPDRLDLKGKLANHIAEIVVAVDISGSITDKEIEQIMTEIFALVKNYASDITIIECDNAVRRIYKIKNIKQIKEKINTRGSTRFSPVFEYLAEHRMRNCLLIYFTDGLGEEELAIRPVHYKTLWVLTGKGDKLSLNESYGIVKKLSKVSVESVDLDYARNELNELRRMEWAK